MSNISGSSQLEMARVQINRHIIDQVGSRGLRAANELRNASQLVLRGRRGGRRYLISGTRRHYTASAPGEPPAVRTGAFRNSWLRKSEIVKRGDYEATIVPQIYNRTMVNGYYLGEILEDGTGKMVPRPHHDKIKQKALRKVVRIYREPYF